MSADLTLAPVGCASGYFTDQFHQQCYKCPAGYDCSTKRYQDMKSCSKGQYALEGEGYCKICPAGYFCPRVDQDKIECPIGTYAYEGSTSCSMCPMGYRCLDKKGKYIVKCSLGQYVDSVTTRCTWCPAGFACPNPESGYDNKVACQPGTYAVAGQAQCTICPPGKYCTYTDKAIALDCPVGKVSFGGATVCQDCPRNHECGNATMSPCPIYHYSLEGTGQCLPCPDGKECNKLKQAEPVACPLGYYIRTLDWKCQPCPHGHFCPLLSADPQTCPKHTYQSYMAQSHCIQCPDGYYSDYKAEYCKPIPPGFQRDISVGGLRTLEKCPEGTYSQWGFKECITCEDGYLCPSGAEFGVQYGCPKGSYCRAGVQYKCPGGMFGIIERAKSDAEGCAVCPAGYYCLPGTEDYKLFPCPRGYFCPINTQIPQECPKGTFNDELFGRSIAYCKLCPMGRQCGVATKDQGATCAKGYFCPLGSFPKQWPCPAGTFSGYRSGLKDQSECMVCPAGNFCPQASVEPKPVTPGYYQPHQGIGEEAGKVICPPGYHCPNSAMTTYKGYQCTPGYFCPAGSTSPTQVSCPEGTFSDSYEIFDAAQCFICPGGYKCGLATTSTTVIQDCPNNEYCPPGTKTSKSNKCPAGQYAPYTNAKSVDDCIPCPFGYYCLSGWDPVLCPLGYYCPKGTEYGSQYPCPGGFYINTLGAKVQGECKSCGLGNYCFEGSTQPLQCPPGFYNAYNNTADQCLECPPGRYCPKLGTREPPKCPPGFYSEKKSSKCQLCPVGTYCPNEATADQELEFQKCPAGVFCMRLLDNYSVTDPTDDSVSSVSGPFGLDVYPNIRDHYCAEGYYCLYAAIEKSPCPIGTYNSVRGRKTELECKRAEPGFYVSVTAAAGVSGLCDPGYYCPEGSISSKQVPCPAGTFRKIPQGGKPDDCTLCTSGGYCPNQGMSQPLPCPAGFYCPLGTKQPEPCPEGTYSSILGLTDSQSCTPCDPGKYCAKKNLIATQDDCDDGYLCIKGSKRPEPDDKITGTICPVGGYCPKGTTEIMWCNDGSFNVFTGGQSLDDCQLCWPGYFCKGQQILVPCEAGYYCEEGSSSYTGIATPGHYAPLGSDRQYQCPRGTYNLEEKKASCTSCEAGRFCATGVGEPIDCPQGYYCSSYDSLKSQGQYYEKSKCPVGTYSSITGRKTSSDCLPCPNGRYCSQPGLTISEGDCLPGYFCNSRAIEPKPQVLDSNNYFGPCPAGYYCEGGANKKPCEAGTYSNEINAKDSTVCKLCTEGYYCPTAGMSQPIYKCDVGYFCPEGSMTSKGRKKDEVVDRKCALATYTSLGLTDLQTTGSYCPLGSPYPIICPQGFYQDSDGSTTLNAKCKACPKGSFCIFGKIYSCPEGYFCV